MALETRVGSSALPGGQMPDNSAFNIGGVTKLQGSEMNTVSQFGGQAQLPEAQMPSNINEDKIGTNPVWIQEATRNPVDIVNSPDPDPMADAIANRALLNSRESMSAEMAAFAGSPHELYVGFRGVLKRVEDGKVPNELENRYALTSLFDRMLERADNLRITPDELKAAGYVKKYDDKTGIGIPARARYSSLCLDYDQEPNERGYDKVTYFYGTPESRAECAKAYDKAILEIETRTIIGAQLGLRLNPETRDGLETLVVYLRGGRTPKFKPDHLEVMYNLPSVKELSGDKPKSVEKARELGDQIEEATVCQLIMLNSGSKEKTEKFLKKPGVKFLIAKMAKEHADKTGNPYTYDRWIQDNIGDLSKWTDDKDRNVGTFKDEAKKGYRKGLAKHSNIPASYEDPGGISGDEEDDFIEKTIGGICGSVEASWIAWSTMQITGTYASEGYVALPNGEFALQLGEDGNISADDTAKFRAHLQVLKEGLKGRSSGLAGMIGKIPDMAMNLYDWAQVKVVQPDGTTVYRSIWNAWLGTEEQDMKDILTQKPATIWGVTSTKDLGNGVFEVTSVDLKTKNITVEKVFGRIGKALNPKTGKEEDAFIKRVKEEGYHRLGDLNFKSLRKGFHSKFATIQWLMGSGERPTGVLNEALRTDFKSEDFSLAALKKINKYVGIVFNPLVMSQGSMHLYDITNNKLIAKNFMRNLMIARVHSFSFSTGILGAVKRLFHPTLKEADVPDPVWISAAIKEILKDNPRTEAELKAHYIDENKSIRKLGKNETSGYAADVEALLKDQFGIDENDELTTSVGRVTGKNSF